MVHSYRFVGTKQNMLKRMNIELKTMKIEYYDIISYDMYLSNSEPSNFNSFMKVSEPLYLLTTKKENTCTATSCICLSH